MRTLLNEQPTTTPNVTDTPTKTDIAGAVGKPIDRLTGRAKVTGRATYSAEVQPEGCVHAVILSSTIASGEIKAIDSTIAEKMPGVLAILSAKNWPKINEAKGGFPGEMRPPMSDMTIHFAGQHVAVVVADTLERARAAAAAIKVDYKADEKPVIAIDDPRGKENRPAMSMGGQLQEERGKVDDALKQADLTIIKQTYSSPTETHNPMETSATVAAWDGNEKLNVWDASQGVVGTRDALASAFGLSKENVRVICPFVGGGFGCKGAFWPHTLITAVAAKVVQKPVRLMLTRSQMFTSCGHRPELEQEFTIAADKSGKLVAMRHDTTMHGSAVSGFVETTAVGTSAVMYDCPNHAMTHVVKEVNVAPPTFMRAPGETPGTFAMESAMDELAIALKIDPIELRLLNYAEKDPAEGKPFSSKKLRECYQLGAEKFGWSKRNPAVGSMKTADGQSIGWGMATAIYPAMAFPATARIRLMVDPRGGVRAISGSATQDLGTGMWEVGAQMTASITGLPIDRVKFELGDTNLPPAGVSGGSTSTAAIAQALSESSMFLRLALLKLCDEKSPLAGLKASDVDLRGDRLVATNDPAKSEPIAPLITRSDRAYVEGMSGKLGLDQRRELGEPTGEDYASNSHKYAFHSFGCHFIEVVIGKLVPTVKVNRIVSVMDVGRVVNPKLARSQVLGGAIMGVGAALMEETVYDPRTAKPVTHSLADYLVCVNADIHSMEVHFIDEPDYHFNAIGCRGVGEIGITGMSAAIANAIHHATGKRIRSLPITPDKLL